MSESTLPDRSLSSWLRKTISQDHVTECSRAMEEFLAMEDHLAGDGRHHTKHESKHYGAARPVRH